MYDHGVCDTPDIDQCISLYYEQDLGFDAPNLCNDLHMEASDKAWFREACDLQVTLKHDIDLENIDKRCFGRIITYVDLKMTLSIFSNYLLYKVII